MNKVLSIKKFALAAHVPYHVGNPSFILMHFKNGGMGY